MRARSPIVALAALALLAIAAAWWFASGARHPGPSGARDLRPAVGAVEQPAGEGVSAERIEIRGWAHHDAGIERVELRVGDLVLPATYGEPRRDIPIAGREASPVLGYHWRGSLSSLSPGRHPLEVWAVSRTGAGTLLGRRSVVVFNAIPSPPAGSAARPFHFLMAYSGTRFGGAKDADVEYAAYQSSTLRTGVTVPVPYMRTTRGRDADWVFDPDFDPNRKCGARRLADDSLNEIVANAVAKQLPTMFILNGGVWADSGCDAPEVDLNDHLEQDAANCQWTQDDAVFADDHLKHLSGSVDSPELARSLTFNVYASEVRRYKRRNLVAAATRIAAFAKAHPDLFVGVTLDADTYMNPFFDGQQWFDYNPGTVRQFRHWLRGTGPYAGDTRSGGADLRAHRRAMPLTLADVNRIAKRDWRSWAAVDPPRRFPGSPRDTLGPADTAYWDDPWFAEWDVFRKHLVAMHYEDLAKWTSEAGIDGDRIFTAQGFSAPYGRNRPFALRVTSTGQNYDSAGMSLEGAKPSHGHLGAILYGRAAENDVPTENGRSLFWNFARVDPGWGIVELSIAALNRPEHVPTYDKAYRAFREAFNFDARLVTLMAWNGMRGSESGKPGYRNYTSWRETEPEEAMKDFAVSHANVPAGARLWTFGTQRLASDDGWTASEGRVVGKPGSLVVEQAGRVVLHSPPGQWLRSAAHRRLVLAHRGALALRWISVLVRAGESDEWTTVGRGDGGASKEGTVNVALAWPASLASASQMRIEIERDGKAEPLEIARIALLP